MPRVTHDIVTVRSRSIFESTSFIGGEKNCIYFNSTGYTAKIDNFVINNNRISNAHVKLGLTHTTGDILNVDDVERSHVLKIKPYETARLFERKHLEIPPDCSLFVTHRKDDAVSISFDIIEQYE